MQTSLADKRQVILLLRLTVDGQGRFVHGEVVDVAGKTVGRYIEWSKLSELIEAWLARDVDSDDSAPAGGH